MFVIDITDASAYLHSLMPVCGLLSRHLPFEVNRRQFGGRPVELAISQGGGAVSLPHIERR